MKSFKKIYFKILLVSLSICLALSGLFFLKFSSGKYYPSVKTNDNLLNQKLEKLISLDFPPGNVTQAPNGKIYFNYHPFAKAERFSNATLFEYFEGKITPFPSFDEQKNLQGVFGLKVDKQNRLWTVEPCGLDFENTFVRAYDLDSRKKVFEFKFPKKLALFAQDLRITANGKFVIVADTGLFNFISHKLFVINTETSEFHTLLENHPLLEPQNWTIKTPYGDHHLAFGIVGFFVGLDGLEISDDEKWLYLAPMTNDSLYRVPLHLVLDKTVSSKKINNAVEFVAKKPLSDGITLLDDQHILITDIENGGFGILNTTNKKYKTLVSDKKIIWADGISVLNNQVLLTDSAIPAYIDQLARPPEKNKVLRPSNFGIYRLKL